jgi:hypothetical protein
MGVLLRYTDFRARAARRISVSGSFTIANSTITRAAGNFIADGVKIGMSVQAFGSAANDGALFTVIFVSQLWILVAETVAVESPTVCTLKFVWMSTDSLEEYPGLFAGQAGHTNLVRANGFNAGFTGIPTGAVGQNFFVSVNGQAPDAIAGVDEYDWYLSQRSDDPAKQWLSCATAHFFSSDTYSGTVLVATTALANAELGLGLTLTVEQQIEVFRFCHLYCRRRSDGAIQWVDLLKAMFA